MAELTLSDGTRSIDFLSSATTYLAPEGLALPVVGREDTFSEGSDSEGRTRVRTRVTNPEGSFTVYLKGDNDSAFWDAVDDLQELVESAHRLKGTLTYVPPNGSQVTYDLEAVSLSGMPQNGVMLKVRHVEITVSFESKPYGRLAPVVIEPSASFSGPIDDLAITEVPGQVDALASLTLTDGSTAARNHVEVGVQHDYDPSDPEPLKLAAVTDISGLAAASNTRSGSLSTNTLRASITTTPVALCVADDQPHSGKWKVRTRVWPSAPQMRIRLAWRAGNAPFTRGQWITISGEDAWFDVDLGTVNIAELDSHTSDFRLEAAAASGFPSIDVDVIYLLPADNYTRLRGDTSQDVPTAAVVAADDFNAHAAGNLAGKTADIGGTWSGAGDAEDFVTGTGYAYRGAISDSSWVGRYEVCGSAVAACTVTADLYPRSWSLNTRRLGLLARYTDADNFLIAYLEQGTEGDWWLYLQKEVATTQTSIGSAYVPEVEAGIYYTVGLSVDAAGNAQVYAAPTGQPLGLKISVTADSSLATSGALDDGKAGFYDENRTLSSLETRVDNFTLVSNASGALIVNPAINSDQSLVLSHNTALTENSSGTGYGTTPIREGRYLTLPPSTRTDRQSRIVVKARRQDGDEGFSDTGTADAITGSVSVTPRVHLLGP